MVVKKIAKAEKTVLAKKLRPTNGVVVSDKMDKTVIVAVISLKKHPKYHKKYLSTKRFKVHDPENRYKKGNEISFVGCRPISKDKRWKAVY